MDLQQIREKHGLTLEQMAQRLGLKSKSYMHDIERTGTVPRGVALRVYEQFDGVRVGPLKSLTKPEIELLRKLERAA